MENFVKQGLLLVKWTPRLESLRFNRRVNVQKPRTPHYIRALFLELTKPQYESDIKTPYKCDKNVPFVENDESVITPDNMLEKIFAKELSEKLETSKLVGFLHTNPIKGEDEFKARVLLWREGIKIEKHAAKTVKRAVEGSIYESILPLFICHNAIVYSEEANVDKLLKVIKKIPQYILLAGIVDKRFLNVNQLQTYAEIKNVTNARAGLVSVLNTLGNQTVNNLTAHQRNLVVQLQMYGEGKTNNTS